MSGVPSPRDLKASAGPTPSDTSIAACAGEGINTVHGVPSSSSMSSQQGDQSSVIEETGSIGHSGRGKNRGKRGFSAKTEKLPTKVACTSTDVKTPAQTESGTKRPSQSSIDDQPSKRFSVSAAVPLSSAVFPLSGHSDGHVVHVSPSSPPPPLLPIGRRQPQPPSDQLHGVAAPAGDSSRSSSAESVDTAVRQAEEEADSEGDKSAAASASATAAATASASAAQADQSHDGDSSISIATPGQGSEVSASESEAAAAAAAPAAVDVDDDDAASDGDESVDATDREMDQRILAHGSIFVDSIECNKSMGQVKEAGEQEVRRKCRAVHWHPSLPVAQREVIVGAVRLPFDGVPVREHAAWRPMVAFAAVAAHDDDNDTVPVEEEEGDEPPPQQQQPMQQILAVTEDEWDEWSMDVDQ